MSAANLCFHWTARLLGAVIGCGILGILLAEVAGPEGSAVAGPTRLENMLLLIVFVSALALLVGWRHEVFGGTVATAGGLVILALPFVSYPQLQPLWPLGLAFVTPGIFYLCSAFSADWNDDHHHHGGRLIHH